MSSPEETLEQRVADLEAEVAALPQLPGFRGVRKRSSATILGWPLYDIAAGPDPARGELRGHARGIVAVGDIATGLLAIGGVARGGICVGGLAIGLITLGGCSLGLCLAMGGAAIGTLAFGGAAIGWVAVGGGAFGYYALGGEAIGQHVISAKMKDPAAIQFFGQLLPNIEQWMARPRG